MNGALNILIIQIMIFLCVCVCANVFRVSRIEAKKTLRFSTVEVVSDSDCTS